MASEATLVAAPHQGLDDTTLGVVRPMVRELLAQAPGFRELAPDQQREIAQTMVRVASFMANPHGLAREEFAHPQLAKELAAVPPAAEPAAKALADAVGAAKGKASDKIGTFAGADFEAGALRQGTEEFRNLVGAVDFPAF